MRTTLKRGVGRGAGLNGTNGHAVFPPGAVSSVAQIPPAAVEAGRGSASCGRILARDAPDAHRARARGRAAARTSGSTSRSARRAGPLDGRRRSPRRSSNVPLPGPAGGRARPRLRPRAGAPVDRLPLGHDHADPRRPVGEARSRCSRSRATSASRSTAPSTPIAARSRRSTRPSPTAARTGSLDTVKQLTGIPINYLITVNFHGFKEIVDKLGGIWLDVDRRYYHVNNGTAAENYANINIEPGYQLLTGGAALDFVRFRHTDDDFHRIARQQEFVRAFKEQFSQQLRPAQAAVDRRRRSRRTSRSAATFERQDRAPATRSSPPRSRAATSSRTRSPDVTGSSMT